MIRHIFFTTILVCWAANLGWSVYRGPKPKGFWGIISGLALTGLVSKGIWDVWLWSTRMSNVPWGYTMDVFWVMTAVGVIFGLAFFREFTLAPFYKNKRIEEASKTKPIRGPKKTSKDN